MHRVSRLSLVLTWIRIVPLFTPLCMGQCKSGWTGGGKIGGTPKSKTNRPDGVHTVHCTTALIESALAWSRSRLRLRFSTSRLLLVSSAESSFWRRSEQRAIRSPRSRLLPSLSAVLASSFWRVSCSSCSISKNLLSENDSCAVLWAFDEF